MEKELIIASSNKGKIREIKEIFSGIKVLPYTEKLNGKEIEIKETGNTFYENALIKARAIFDITKTPVLADDSGLCVKALNGEPGIFSARYSGTNTDYGNQEKLLKELENKKDRTAKFVCTLVIYDGKKIITERGETKGEILKIRTGKNGFGYDCLFYSKELKKSFGLATEEEKNSVSHRGKAIKKIKRRLKELW